MGVSGEIVGYIGNTAHSGDYKYYIRYSEGNYNIENNTSPVTATVYIRCYNHSAYNYSQTYTTTLNIDGHTFSNSLTGMSLSPGTVVQLCTGTYNVSHNSDGTRTITISASSPSLPTGSGYGPNSGSANGNVTLTTIPRASKVSLSTNNFAIGNNVRIYSNRVSSSFTHTARITFNGQTLANKTNIGAYLDWNTSDLFPLMTDKSESSGTVTLYTYSGSTQIGSPTTVSFVANAKDQRPTFTNFQYEDINSTILALTGNSQKIVLKYSDIKVKIPTSMKMIPKKSATGKEYVVSAQTASSISLKYSSTAEVSGTIDNFNSTQLTVTAYDSRSNSTIVTKQLSANIIQYKELVLTSNFRLERTNFVGNSITISGGGTWKNVNFGSVTNSIKTMTIQIQNPSGSWSQVYDIKNLFNFDTNGTWYNKDDNEFSSFNFVFGTEYNVQIIVKDELSTITVNAKVNGGNVLLDGLKGYGVAVGGIFDKTKGVFQVHKGTAELLDLDANGMILRSSAGNIILDVKDGGLLSRQARIISGQNLNTYCSVFSGYYMGDNLTNSPTGKTNWFFIQHIAHNALYSRQIAYDFFNDEMYVRRQDNGTWNSWKRIHSSKVLYDNSSGTTGTVTLSETAGNFEYLEIYYRNINYSIYTSTKIQSPNGKNALLDAAFTFGSESGVRIAASRQVTISGTTISTTGEYGVWDSFSGITGNNNILIVKVVGYR